MKKTKLFNRIAAVLLASTIAVTSVPVSASDITEASDTGVTTEYSEEYAREEEPAGETTEDISDGNMSADENVPDTEENADNTQDVQDTDEGTGEDMPMPEGSEDDGDKEPSEESIHEDAADAENQEQEESAVQTETVPVRVPTFDREYEFSGNFDGQDFSSCRLLAATGDSSIFTWDTTVLSEYNGVYLLSFTSEEETRNAYSYYYSLCDFVEADMQIVDIAADVADGVENEDADIQDGAAEGADLENINQNNDAISTLNALTEESSGNYNGVIAVIDTGASDADGIIDRVSVIGDDVSDDNGHGDDMVRYIIEENENAQILSVKALDASGTGSISDLYAAIEYAVSKDVDIINLSVSAFATEGSETISMAVRDASDAGITVVGAAGNNSRDARYYIPGSIDEVIVTGACDENGQKIPSSNYGDTVDYNVKAQSTSEAAARMSGFISKNDTESIDGVLNEGLIFSCDYNAKETEKPQEEDGKVRTAEDTTWQNDWNYSLKDGVITVGRYKGESEDVNIPATAVIDGQTYSVTLASTAFQFDKTIKKLSVENGVKASGSCTYLFNSSVVEEVDLRGLKTSDTYDMSKMFYNCKNLKTLNINGFDTSKAKDMDNMFYNCKLLESLDVSSFNTSSVKDMSGMFSWCESLKSLDISGFDTSQVTDMSTMFYNCKSMESLNVGDMDTRSATNMGSMFSSCTSLASLDVSGFNTSNVTNMRYMFNECSAIDSLDVSGFSTSKVENMEYMFSKCKAEISGLSNWDTSNVTNFKCIFSDYKGTNIDGLSGWNVSGATNMSGMFYNCLAQSIGDLSNWNVSNVTSMANMFGLYSGTTVGNLSNWNVSNVTNLNSMFERSKITDVGDLSGWNVSKVTNMGYMFDGSELTDIGDISKWNVSNVTTMMLMFYNSKLNSLNLSGWNTSNLESMRWMFLSCKASSINVSGWDTSKVTDMNNAFAICTLDELDLSSFDTSSVTNKTSMFASAKIQKLILGNNTHIDGTSLSGRYVRESTGEVMTADEIMSLSAGNDMADTYYRATEIKFNANGGLPTAQTLETYLGAAFKESSVNAVTKKGCDFDGWYTEKAEGEKLSEGSRVTQDTYYAHWKEHTYTLVLKENAGEKREKEVTLAYNQVYSLRDDIFERDGYVITGWNTQKDGTGTDYPAGSNVLRLTEEDGGIVTLFAQWADAKKTITFDSTGGTPVASKKVNMGEKAGTLTGSQKEGFSFAGWYTAENDGTQITANTVINDDITVYAHWTKDPVVTFNTAGGAEVPQRRLHYGSKVGTLPKSSNKNMTLIGWYTADGEKITADTVVTEDVTFYAKWGYAPKFNANGGKITELPEYEVLENPVYTFENLPTAERDGYDFIGWFTPDGNEIKPGDSLDLSLGNEISARWERSGVSRITLDPNGGVVLDELKNPVESPSVTVFTGEPIGELPIPQKDGCVFDGWFDQDGNRYTAGDSVDGDITLTAGWSEKNITVTFNGENGTYENSPTRTVQIPSGGKIQDIPGFINTGYILEGWHTERNGQGTKLTKDTVFNEDTSYYANWVPELVEDVTDKYAYSYAASWINASNVNADNEENNLNIHPVDEKDQTASLHIRFELSNAIQGDKLPVGAVKIRIPKYVFKDWDGNNAGSNNISRNIPEYPTARAGMVFSYIEEDDAYILVNNTEMGGGTGVDATISYTVSPWVVNGGAIDENGKYVEDVPYYQNSYPIEFTVDENGDGTPELTETKNLDIEFHTKVVSEQAKEFYDISYSWNKSWGDVPADANDYFYITWRVRQKVTKGTNQPYKYAWDEDSTVHDGTVVYTSEYFDTRNRSYRTSYMYSPDYTYIVTRHPNSLLQDIPEEGRVIHNEAIVTEYWRSGYETPHRVSADYVLRDAAYPKGEFDKHIKGWTVSSNHTIEGGQETILDDKAEIKLPYEITYDGSSRNTPVFWNEETKTYTANRRIISFTDGISGDVMYSSGFPSAKHVWEPVTGNVTLNDDDYYFKNIKITVVEKDSRQNYGVWAEPYENYDKDIYEDVDIYIRKKDTDEFVYFRTIRGNDTSTITFPADTAGFEIRHASTYYATELTVNTDIMLKPTNRVQALIQDDVDINTTSIIKNRALCDIWNEGQTKEDTFFHVTDYTGGNNSAFKEIYELNISKTSLYAFKDASSKDRVLFDVERGTQDNPIVLEGRNYNNSGRKKVITSCTFYDLLPAGTSVDENSIFIIPISTNYYNMSTSADYYSSYVNSRNRINKGYYNVEYISDWQGSGRTMMKVDISVPRSTGALGFDVYYLLHNTYENIVACGTTVENDIAFIDTTPGHVTPSSSSGKITTITEKQYFDDINRTYGLNVGFAKDNTNYIPVDAYSWMFDKSVRSGKDYEKEGVIRPGGEYVYRLKFAQSEYAECRNITYFDVLEAGTDEQTDEWHGTLKYVDVSSIKNVLTKKSDGVHCAPVVYYSTKDRHSFTGADYDVSNKATWTDVKPADSSSITAVAIDCSKDENGEDFILYGKQMMTAYVVMEAPTDAEYVAKRTANEAVIYTQKPNDENPQPEKSDSEIEIEDTEPEIHKTSVPETGTAENPSRVSYEGNLTYTLKITNKDELFTINDIVVEDVIPDGLITDVENIKVHFGNEAQAIAIGASPRASVKKTGRKLTFNINSLPVGESIYFVIPNLVNAKEGTLVNQAVITKVEGRDKELKSETTYHDIIPFDVVIRKLDSSGGYVTGAKLQVIGNDGKIAAEWITEGSAKTIGVKEGSYRLHEAEVPDGYVKAEDISFTVDGEGKVSINGTITASVDMVDTPGVNVVGTKKWSGDSENDRPSSITVSLLRDNEKIAETVTDASKGWKYEFKNLPKFRDEQQTEEYVYSVMESPVTGYRTVYETMQAADALEIVFSKDSITESPNYDYVRIIYEMDGKLYKTADYGGAASNERTLAGRSVIIPSDNFWLYWRTDSSVNGYGFRIESITPVHGKDPETGTVISALPSYSPVELSGGDYPETEHNYGSNENRLWHYSAVLNGDEYNIINEKITAMPVVISKADINGDEIAGASLKITGREEGTDTDITPIEWVSEAGVNKTVNLKPGTYTLEETAVPEGGSYVKASNITFTVDRDGNVKVADRDVDKVTMVDDYAPHEIVVSKTDVNGNEIAGAKLKITGRETGADTDITPIEWVSEAGVNKTVNLKPGTYTLEETAVPEGGSYVKASNITFTVDKDGNIKVADKDVDKVTMVDDYAPHEVVINKTDVNGDEIAGAKMKVTGREEGADTDIAPIEWTSEAGVNKTVNLKPGTYTLHEEAVPEGGVYVLASDITFTVDKDGKVKVADKDVDKVTMVDEYAPHEVIISKTDINGNEIAGAQMKITGRETGSDKDIAPVEWTSEAGRNKTVSLKPGEYVLHEEAAPKNYLVASDIAFTVDKDGNVKVKDAIVDKVVMEDAFDVGSLNVKKTVTGNMGSRNKDFQFILILKNSDDTPYTREIAYRKGTETGKSVPDGNGRVSFTLAHNEDIVFSDIFVDTKYEIQENDYREEGYTTTSVNASGIITKAETKASFTNNNGTTVSTGVYVSFAGGIAAILAVLLIMARKKNKFTH